MDSESKIPNENLNQEKKEKSINKKGTLADGQEINQQVEDRRNKYRPRDNA